jgi:transcriptional regulator with XRE-family HTH domain
MTGKELRKLRESIGVSQARFANATELSVRTISRWETGKGKIPKSTAKGLIALAPRLREFFAKVYPERKKHGSKI